MVSVLALWLPIVLSAVFVFAASSVIHMTPLWHRTDYPKAPDEDKIRDALRPLRIPPGDYMIPRPANSAAMRAPEFLEKMKQGPVLMLTVMPNQLFTMGRNLALWFVYCLVVGVFSAYVAGHVLGAGTAYLRVFQIIGATAFMGYALALWQMSIWYRRALSLTIKSTVDGLIYALLTAGTFGWLWPH
jgi:hypothetical protein